MPPGMFLSHPPTTSTSAHHQHTVHPLTLNASFNAVRNHFTTHKRIFHTFGTHGHAIRNSRRTKNLSIATSLFNALNRSIGQFLQATVARRDGAVTIGHTHHGFHKITFFIPHGVVHRAVWRPGLALSDIGTAAVARSGRVNRDDFVSHVVTLWRAYWILCLF